MRQPTSNISGRGTSFNIIFPERDFETINGTSSDDILFGSARDTKIVGGDGNDLLLGGDGNDLLEGDSGNDTLWGNSGSDLLRGGADNDQLLGGDDRDFLAGGSGNDLLLGGADDDQLLGEDGNDELFGGDGSDLIEGNGGNDTLGGDSGNDKLRGGDGNDYLDGYGGGSDEIDLVRGGSGADIFVIGDSAGVDYQSGNSEDTEDFSFAIFEDFSVGEDFIQVSGSAESYELITGNLSTLDILGADDGLDTGIYLGDDLIAIIENVTIDNYDRFVSAGSFSLGQNPNISLGSLDRDEIFDGVGEIDFSFGSDAIADFQNMTFEDFDKSAFI